MHDAHHLTILQLLLLAISGIRALSTTKETNNTEELLCELGDTVTFSCPLRQLPARVTWIKLPNRTLAIGNRIVHNDDRLEVRGAADRTASRLLLVNANRSDSGVYECRQAVTKVTKRISLVVRYAPIIAKNPDAIAVEKGEMVQLFCDVEGHPMPNVTWRRTRVSEEFSPKMDDIVFLGSLLNITSVQADDRGTYSCEANNGIKPNAIWDFQLQVEFGPELVALKPNVSQAINYTAVLVCQIEGFPTPEVTWTKVDDDGDEWFTNDTRHSIVNVLREGPMMGSLWIESRVTVDSVRPSDFGNYTCTAENSRGQNSAAVTLSESPFPVLPQIMVDDGKTKDGSGGGGGKAGFQSSGFNVTGFILGMMPPLWISFYIILHLGFRSRYAEERPEEEGGDGLDEIVWEQGFHSKY